MKADIDRILGENNVGSVLLHSESYRNVNMFYVSGFLAIDPFLYLKRVDQEPILVINQMELDRAKKESNVRDVRSTLDCDFMSFVRSAPDPKLGIVDFVASVAKKELGTAKPIYVPPDFSVMYADSLRRKGLKIKPMFDVLEKARETKEPEEVRSIASVQRTVEKAASKVIETISEADIAPDGTLTTAANGRKEKLTVGRVRAIFDHTFVDDECLAEEETMIPCGPKSAVGHYAGKASDVLKANEPIVMDVFPKSVRNRYVSDMTRTVVKGRASKTLRRMFETVAEARDSAIDALRAGVLGSEMQELCFNIFEKAGYDTIRGGKKVVKGYNHSLGHGVGLQVHEGPSMSEFYKFPISEHSVVTVEPGLYDPKVGGVRIEDIVEITRAGSRNLTEMKICLEI
jgi:Xaa-Pro aminopeptidase